MNQQATPTTPQRSQPRPRAGASVTAWALLLAVLLLGMGTDLLSKHLAFENIWIKPVQLDREVILSDPDWHPPVYAHRVVLANILDLRLVLNRGAVFGIGPGQRYFFVGFTMIAVIVGLGVFAFKTKPTDRVAHVAIGFILAGAVGNLYDRIAYGAVRDFLNLFPDLHLPLNWSWPGGNSEIFPWVFNVADVFLLMGIGLLMIVLNRKDHSRSAPRQAEAPAK